MAKIIKLDNPKEEFDFQDLCAQQPEEMRQMLDAFNISSFEDIMRLAVMMGIDPDKMSEFCEKNGTDKLPTMEEIMFDDDNPAGDFYRMLRDMENYEEYDNDDDELDPFELPDTILFDELPAKKYHLRIKLNNAPVPIWREVEVPSNISLEFLAFVIIEAMGWDNLHLHQFKKGDIIYQNRTQAKQEDNFFVPDFSLIRTHISDNYPISDIFKEKGDRIKFEYDFGDCWNHDIWLKGISEYQLDEPQKPILLKGKGMCPPEDCGGVYGYASLLEILSKKRKSAEEKEQLEWYGIKKDYNPNEFDFDWIEDNICGLWDAMDE